MPQRYCQKRLSRSLSLIVMLNDHLNIFVEVDNDIYPIAA